MIVVGFLIDYCYPDIMLPTRFYLMGLLFAVLLFSACDVVPAPVATPALPCENGQTSTPETPCVAGVDEPATDPGSNPGEPGGNPTDPGGNPTPQGCKNSPATVRSSATLCSSTTLKNSYAQGSSDTVVMSVKLLDATVTFIEPTIVFDIVRVNADRSTTSVAADLLDGRPSANPNIFERAMKREELLAGLKASVAFKFKSSAPAGKYVMVLSLFKDADAFNVANLVGRIFYDLEIK